MNPHRPEDPDRLERQIGFILQIDKLKSVLRRTRLLNGERRENSAEHSWHLAMVALLLVEYAEQPDLDLAHVVRMALVHDLVEMEAGDTFCYDAEAVKGQKERETQAAGRVFGTLPPDQASELRALWEEYEAGETPEAQYLATVDRLQPMLHNYHTRGGSWQEHGITRDQVRVRNAGGKAGSAVLWSYVEDLIDDAVLQGFLAEKRREERGARSEGE